MIIYDYIALGLKNLKINLIRTFLAMSIISIGVFLILIFNAMNNTMIQIREVKTDAEIDLRQITINGYKLNKLPQGEIEVVFEGIDIQDMKEIKQLNEVKGVYPKYRIIDILTIDSFNPQYGFDKLVIGGLEIYSIDLWGLNNELDFFDIGKIEREKIKNPDFEAIVVGREFDRNTNEFEIIVPHLFLYKLSEYNDKPIFELVDEYVSLYINGIEVPVKIVGTYSHKMNPNNSWINETSLENLSIEDLYYCFDFDKILLFLPVFINETLAREIILRSNSQTSEYKYTPQEVIITLEDISQVEEVSEYIESNYNYYVKSKILEAKIAINSLFFYRKVLGLIGVFILIIALVSTTNTMFMVLRERVRYIGILKSLGFKKQEVLAILSVESMLIGFFGGIIGVFIAYVCKFLISLVLRNILAQTEMYQYVIFGLNSRFVVYAIIGSTIIAFISGIVPAIIGSKLQPLDALQK
ncbi:ABC transporter permease [Anaerobranca gottschalkii]|uniref:MacB-like core domain-containing protein n=1 Tax=Anaerobranca gottschalkii DSM 13577 TaxID=1120990 RepID=A0A1I0CSP1_9FIRM|nr:FtsX-like permease family protein [Anaerobranca gottschalkii]SET22092.1 MacB-like core domain-containing protein [Anaerobranca gottschalkii DSM 13577]